jgi:hypothetical protein
MYISLIERLRNLEAYDLVVGEPESSLERCCWILNGVRVTFGRWALTKISDASIMTLPA